MPYFLMTTVPETGIEHIFSVESVDYIRKNRAVVHRLPVLDSEGSGRSFFVISRRVKDEIQPQYMTTLLSEDGVQRLCIHSLGYVCVFSSHADQFHQVYLTEGTWRVLESDEFSGPIGVFGWSDLDREFRVHAVGKVHGHVQLQARNGDICISRVLGGDKLPNSG